MLVVAKAHALADRVEDPPCVAVEVLDVRLQEPCRHLLGLPDGVDAFATNDGGAEVLHLRGDVLSMFGGEAVEAGVEPLSEQGVGIRDERRSGPVVSQEPNEDLGAPKGARVGVGSGDARERLDELEQLRRKGGVAPEHRWRPHDLGADLVLSVAALALELVLDGGQLLGIEQGQVTGNRVQDVVGGDAVSERLADHAPDDLSDVGGVAGRTLRVEHLGPRAVPAGRDRLLGEHDPDVGVTLDRLRLHPVDSPGAEHDRLVLAEHVGRPRQASARATRTR